MDENQIIDGADTQKVDTTNKEDNNEVTYTQADLDSKIQSETDRVRTKYSKQLKDLQAKIDELSPIQKTEEQLAFEKRVADFESKQKEIEAKERFLNIQSALQSRNIDVAMASFLKSDIDTEEFETAINKVIADKMKASGYVPTNHKPNPPMTKEEWNALGYIKQTELHRTNPELAESFMKKRT